LTGLTTSEEGKAQDLVNQQLHVTTNFDGTAEGTVTKSTDTAW
jgi:hypothetical protein